MKNLIFRWILIGAIKALSLFMFIVWGPSNEVIMHWNGRLEPDAWTTLGNLCFILASIEVLLSFVFISSVIAVKSAERQSIEKGQDLPGLSLLVLLPIALSFFSHFVIILIPVFSANLTPTFIDYGAAVIATVMAHAPLMVDLKRNALVGIRTAATLGSDATWESVHRLAVKWLSPLGVIAVAPIIFREHSLLLMVVVLGSVVVTGSFLALRPVGGLTNAGKQ